MSIPKREATRRESGRFSYGGIEMHRENCIGNSGTGTGRFPSVLTVIGIAAAVTLLLSSDALTLTGGLESDFASRYVWRGLVFSSAGVMQDYAWASAGYWTASVWSNCDLASDVEGGRFDEVDVALAVTTSVRGFDLEPSVQAYVYPDQPDSPGTVEVAMDASWTAYAVQPFVVYTFDIKEYDGAAFGEAGLRSVWDIGETVSLEASAEIGWGSARFNEAYIGAARPALNLAGVEAAVTWNCWRGIYLWPHVAATTILDDDVRGLVERPSFVQLGIAFGGEF